MNTLLMEILASLFAAGFFSLFIGWIIRGALANREVKAINAKWEAKSSELELRYKQDTEQLEDQLHLLSTESKQLNTRNDSINESLRENEISVHKARTDAIELNRQQADTQERLQRIIAQKDEELQILRTDSSTSNIGKAGSAMAGIAAMNTDEAEAKIATLSAKREAWEAERQSLINSAGDDQATIAIDPADLPSASLSDALDQTVRIDAEQIEDLNILKSKSRDIFDVESDKTLTIDEDQTMLLDDNNMNTNRPKKPLFEKPTPGGIPDTDD